MFGNKNNLAADKGTETPSFLQRGTALLLANKTAVDANPRKDVQYPNWGVRYVNNRQGIHTFRRVDELCNNGVGIMLTEPPLQVEYQGGHWSAWTFLSKEFVAKQRRSQHTTLGAGFIFNGFASAKVGTMLILNTQTGADVDTPGQQTSRLYCSELMYQAWRDTCLASSEARDAHLPAGGLKFVVIALVVNQGTCSTMRHVVELRRLLGPPTEAGPVTFSSSDEDEHLDAFRMLVGTDNGQPVARLCADHAESLGAKQIVKVHVWSEMPCNPEFGALAFELG
ncbi:hypothetical protein MFRU_036g00070 [Monilinia fructicola]|nr:hypothetical protein MFRU_036g00070 [Monilinia fructicola]